LTVLSFSAGLDYIFVNWAGRRFRIWVFWCIACR